jgi:hypothetical protein
MTTQLPEDPLKNIITWQTEYKQIKQECGVAEMDTPGTTKDSRESLHDTKNATDSMGDWRTFWKEVLDETEENFKIEEKMSVHKQKTIDDFLDTICCALEEMSGEEVFDCFFEAVQSQHEYKEKEYNKINELMDFLIGLK